jgi:prepilin-type N-terminal cleavage/methylation domain-containing protein
MAGLPGRIKPAISFSTGGFMHKIRELYNRPASQGFTLIEMAIVLVVIGLILGMVFKGRQLIASAKVKNANAGYNKVIAGMNTFYDRYGFYPGDGCETSGEEDPTNCNTGRNGIVGTGSNNAGGETSSFWTLMIQGTDILSASDRESSLGNEWNVNGSDDSESWIYVTSADTRIVCDLDRVADDGNSGSGDIIAHSDVSSGWQNSTSNNEYSYGDDCWDLTGTTGVQLRVLP